MFPLRLQVRDRRFRSTFAANWLALRLLRPRSTNERNRNNENCGGIMANIPDDLHYSKDHEWVRVDGNVAIVGITDYAQDSLGDVVYVELPKPGDEFAAHESFGSVE